MSVFRSILAFGIILMILPIMLIVSILILLEDGMPVFFVQNRLGQNKSTFKFYKFRSMHRETPQISTDKFIDGKNYVLKIGKILRKSSLDELPNLINIFLGQMNFIGPRPAQVDEEPLVRLRFEKGIYEMKPGLTGWAQVNGRDQITVYEKVEHEEFYLKNSNFFFDLKILFKTIFKIFSFKEVKY